MLEITNDGPGIVSTNFWDLDLNKRGKYYFSLNAGAVRMLVPDLLLNTLKTEFSLANRVVFKRAGQAINVILDDGTRDPFTFQCDVKSVDRLPPATDDGKECTFTAWTRGPRKIFECPCKIEVS